MCYKDRAINRVNLNYKLYFTYKYAGFLFKGCCIFRLPLTHGHSSKYQTILSAFILPVQTFYSTFMRFKAISIRVQYSILAECARSNKPPCCEKTLYHNCVFNCINWITGGEKVTVLEWKWWATVSGAASIPTLTGKQSNWFFHGVLPDCSMPYFQFKRRPFSVFAEQTSPSSVAPKTCQVRTSNLWWWMTSAGSCSVVWALIRKHIFRCHQASVFLYFLGRINKYRLNTAVSQKRAEGT